MNCPSSPEVVVPTESVIESVDNRGIETIGCNTHCLLSQLHCVLHLALTLEHLIRLLGVDWDTLKRIPLGFCVFHLQTMTHGLSQC